MRAVGVVTVGRSDYGVYLPVLREIQREPSLELRLIVGGMHLSPEFGSTVDAIEEEGFDVNDRVEMLLSSDTPEGVAKSMGMGLMGFGQAYARSRPDVLVVLGDRFEMHAAALAALPFKIPVAHIHGGELTQGAFDDALRHSITKLSHLHFVSCAEYGRRVAQMGEERWRITVSGSPSLDQLKSVKLLDPASLEASFGIQMTPPPLLVTFHPVTLEVEQTGWQVSELLAALESINMPVLFTQPNADNGGRIITDMIQDFVGSHPSARMVDNLGPQGYASVLALAPAMVGNSSSGMLEAAPMGIPVVNIGTRQQGRLRTANIIDVGYAQNEIIEGIQRAVTPEFREMASNITSPYGDGRASERIVSVLKQIALDDRLITKRFADYSVAFDEDSSSANSVLSGAGSASVEN